MSSTILSNARWGSRLAVAQGERSAVKAWAVATVLLWSYALAWWLELRPGLFTDDSAFYLTRVLTGDASNLKPFFYGRFLQLISAGGWSLQYLALLQALIGLLMVARMFALAWLHQAPAWLLAVSAALVVNPFCVAMLFYVQNDPLFSVSLVAMLVETLHCRQRGRVSRTSMAIVAVLAPMSLLFRQNGVLFTPLWALTLPWLLGRTRAKRLLLPAAATCALALASGVGVRTADTLDARFPVVAHTIAGLARADYPREPGTNLSEQTRELLGAERTQLAASYFTPRHWDFVGFHPEGPLLQTLESSRQDALVSSFVRHDLWANFPAVVAMRTEMLLSILLARGPAVEPGNVPVQLPETLANTVRANNAHPTALTPVLAHSLRQPWMASAAWSLLLLLGVVAVAFWRHDATALWACGLLLVQLLAIAAVAPSADARYVFQIYLSPFVLMLVVGAWRQRTSRAGAANLPPAASP